MEFLSKQNITAVVSSKLCRLYSISEENGVEPPQHIYPHNYEGSSKVMEVDAALHLYKELHESSNKCLYLKVIAADDDSSMRALIKHTTTNPKGRLPQEMPKP